LVTGGTSGIGFFIAKRFAGDGFNLVLVARDAAELSDCKHKLQQVNAAISIRTIPTDLSKPEEIESLVNTLKKEEVHVDFLVNDAARAEGKLFIEHTPESVLATPNLNCSGTVYLTRYLIEPMLQRKKGKILNIASIAAFFPGTKFALYHASKAFLLHWSEALYAETLGTGVSVTAVCPGPVDTKFPERAGLRSAPLFQTKFLVWKPEDMADAAYDAMWRNERRRIPGWIDWTMCLAVPFVPQSVLLFVGNFLNQPLDPSEGRNK